MTDTQSGPPEPETATDEHHARFLKSLIKVLKDNRNVLPSLPEMMERSLDKEVQIPSLTEPKNAEDNSKDDLERLAARKREDMEKQLKFLKGDIDVKTQRVTALDQNIREKTATIEALKNEQSTLMSTKDRKSMEQEFKKRDKQLEASEKEIKFLKDETLKLKNELQKKEKEKSETAKLQEEKLAKKDDDLQRLYDGYNKTLQKHKARNDSLNKQLGDKDEDIKVYIQSLTKMKDNLSNAQAKMDQYKSRLASLSEKRVKQDQRSVEDTLGSNRQSELERDFSAFFDEERMDACEKMQSIYQNIEETYQYIYYPRLACIIFETAYEQVKEAKDTASDVFKELIRYMIDEAPQMGQFFATKRKSCRRGQDDPSSAVTTPVNIWGDGAEHSNDIMDGLMLSLKEVAHTCNLDNFVDSVSRIAIEKWTNWCHEDKSCEFTPALNLVQALDKYIKACIRLTWRMVTQVPPMKLEFHWSKFNKDIHKNMGYHSSLKMRSRTNRPSDQDQEEIACYLWPGLQDGGGRLIRAGEVICKMEEQ